MRLAAIVLLLPAVALATPTERRLHADQVTASTFLWNDWNRFQENYHPLYVSDDDPKTAWTEGADSSGAGEWLKLAVSKMDGATRARLRIRAGYQKSEHLFKANARPREVVFKTLPGGVEKTVTLADAQGWQEVVVEQPSGPLEAIELRFKSVYEGAKYTDLCISDIQVFVTAETPENPAFEKSKLDKVLAWKASRVAAAKAFKDSAGKDIPLLPGYAVTFSGESTMDMEKPYKKCKSDQRCWMKLVLEAARADAEVGKHAAALALVEKAIAPEHEGFVVGQVAPVDRRLVPTVDGLEVPRLYAVSEVYDASDNFSLPLIGTMGSLRSDQLGNFATTETVELDKVLSAKHPACGSEDGKIFSFLHREPAADGRERLRAMLLAECGKVEQREGVKRLGGMQVVVYDDAGHLEMVAGPGYVDTFEWAEGKLVSGRARLVDGRSAKLSRPEVASKP